MKTSYFLVKIQSQVAKPALDTLIIELENHFEEFLYREVLFVRQCYISGAKIWWRKVFRLGLSVPSEEEIRNWLIIGVNPSFWRGFNPKVMLLAREHFDKRVAAIKFDLEYARSLVVKCSQTDEIDVDAQFVEKLLK